MPGYETSLVTGVKKFNFFILNTQYSGNENESKIKSMKFFVYVWQWKFNDLIKNL